MLESDKDGDKTATEPMTVDPYKTYKLSDLQVVITIRTPLDSFKMPFSPVYLHPIASRWPKR